eukprot:m.121105 g.121105  ORF g.121105 m.121105 type:complete len:50 (+) comp28844_c0_seq16:1732-1881(+)
MVHLRTPRTLHKDKDTDKDKDEHDGHDDHKQFSIATRMPSMNLLSQKVI